MRRVPIAVCLAAAAVVCGAADRPGLAKAFKGTVVSTYPDGRQGELWLNADGSYTAEGRRHDRSSGHWKLKDEQICLKQSKPLPVPFSYCTNAPSSGKGAWSAKAVSGETIRVKIVPGRAQLNKVAANDKSEGR
jgi:hypothetical protein